MLTRFQKLRHLTVAGIHNILFCTSTSPVKVIKLKVKLGICFVSESSSCSVMPASLWPHGSSADGILQARILKWLSLPS